MEQMTKFRTFDMQVKINLVISNSTDDFNCGKYLIDCIS